MAIHPATAATHWAGEIDCDHPVRPPRVIHPQFRLGFSIAPLETTPSRSR